MNRKKVLIAFSTIAILILVIFLTKRSYKILKNGNNISNKSADEIENYILNIESYYTIAEINTKSNKNENKYKVKQQYIKEGNIYKQEVLEPENIAGTQFIYKNNTLIVENSKLNLKKIYKDYANIESNELSLNSFIEDYKTCDTSKCYENNNKIIMETKTKNGSKYSRAKTLYINKEDGKIEKMEIKDETQTTRIYILYNEIEINTLNKEEV